MKTKILIVASAVLLTVQSSMGQGTAAVTSYGLPKTKDFDRFSVGVYGGICLFQGDLREKNAASNSTENFKTQPALGLQFNYQVTHSIGLLLRAGAARFDQSPSDSIYYEQLGKAMMLNYKSPVSEGSLNMVFSFGNISFLKRNQNLHFIASTGIGLMTHEATLRNVTTDKVVLQDDKATEVMIPFGFGVKYKVGPIDLGLTFDYNKMFTDDVDGISAGNSYDGYSHVLLNVNYTFGKKKKAMEWVNPMELVYNDLSDMKQKVEIGRAHV